LFEELGIEKIDLFRKIFEANNSEMVYEFFRSPTIKKLWPFIQHGLKYSDCFGRARNALPNKKILPTYEEVYHKLHDRKSYNLELPSWWKRLFSAPNEDGGAYNHSLY
jgi:hypothetical protein